MTISLDAIFQSLGSIAKSTDVEGLATSTSEIFADGFVGKSTILGNNIGDSSGGIESLSAAMTTRAQKSTGNNVTSDCQSKGKYARCIRTFNK